MKDLFQFLAERAQKFLPLFFRIVAHPRVNIATLARREDAVPDAILFFTLTSAVGLALQAPFISERNEFTTAAAILSIYKVIEMMLAAFALVLVFRLLRGKAAYEQTFVAAIYIICPIYLLVIVTDLLIIGLLQGYDAALAREWRLNRELSDATWEAVVAINWRSATLIYGVFMFQAIAILGWLITCWPVFAELNDFSRWRTVASFILGVGVLVIVGETGLIIISTLFPQGLGGAL